MLADVVHPELLVGVKPGIGTDGGVGTAGALTCANGSRIGDEGYIQNFEFAGRNVPAPAA